MLVRKATSKLCKKPSKVERLTLTGLEQNIIIRYNITIILVISVQLLLLTPCMQSCLYVIQPHQTLFVISM